MTYCPPPTVAPGAPRPQAFIKVVRGGGCRSPKRLREQWEYLSRKGKIELKQSGRYGDVVLPRREFRETARGWAAQSGTYPNGEWGMQGDRDLTTHIVVSFNPGTDEALAEQCARAWVERVFGGHTDYGNFPYVTAFHTDRDHPHLHAVIHRRAADHTWLKIAQRHPWFNYQNMREQLVEVGCDSGLELDATTRAERGIMERPITQAEFHRRRAVADGIAATPTREPDQLTAEELLALTPAAAEPAHPEFDFGAPEAFAPGRASPAPNKRSRERKRIEPHDLGDGTPARNTRSRTAARARLGYPATGVDPDAPMELRNGKRIAGTLPDPRPARRRRLAEPVIEAPPIPAPAERPIPVPSPPSRKRRREDGAELENTHPMETRSKKQRREAGGHHDI